MDEPLRENTSTTKETKYDEHEAARILSDAAEEFAPDRQGRQVAAFKLLQQLADLCMRIGIRAQIPQHRFEKMVQIANNRGGAISVLLEEDGQICVTELEPTHLSKRLRIPLTYNRLTKLLEGESNDDTVVPRPGEPRPKRSALAVVAEHAFNELRKNIQPET